MLVPWIVVLLHASPAPAQELAEGPRLEVAPLVQAGNGSLRWSVGTGNTAFSELHYQNIDSRAAGFSIRWTSGENQGGRWLVTGEARRGRVLDGTVRDSDFIRGSEIEIRRIHAELTRSRTSHEMLALGRMAGSPLPGADRVVLLVGWERRRQVFRMQDGIQVLPDTATAFLKGLDSRYSFEWRGPWVAYEAAFEIGRASSLAGRLTGHLARYEAEGEWNLREDLVQPRSFAQEAFGFGLGIGIRYERRMSESLRLLIGACHARRGVLEGDDRVYFTDGRVFRGDLMEVGDTRTDLRLEVAWSFGRGSSTR